MAIIWRMISPSCFILLSPSLFWLCSESTCDDLPSWFDFVSLKHSCEVFWQSKLQTSLSIEFLLLFLSIQRYWSEVERNPIVYAEIYTVSCWRSSKTDRNRSFTFSRFCSKTRFTRAHKFLKTKRKSIFL